AIETSDGQRFVKSIIGPTMGMGGGGNLVDDFGNFVMTCKFPKGQMKDHLAKIKADFQIAGVYKVQGSVRIDAYSQFQRFASVNRYGLFKIQASQSDVSDDEDLSFSFYGKWWRQNINDPSMPVFTDDDVHMFKSIFEAEIGPKDSCDIAPKPNLADAQ